jgi:flavin reductase (DIM6/NTAB) family NADH-FMN oxidoreductase RutF
MSEMKFQTIEPKILYFGTPVALISSLNEDGATNIAPMSSFWALGWTLLLGINESTQTADNLRRHPECVVNLPAPEMWGRVEILAPLTAKNPVPEIKAKSKYHYEREKFEAAKLIPQPSELVKPARVQECPVQMEARVRAVHELGGKKLQEIGGAVAVEVEVLRVHVASDLVFNERYINPAKWSPLIYNFRHYYRLAPEELGKTFRAEI